MWSVSVQNSTWSKIVCYYYLLMFQKTPLIILLPYLLLSPYSQFPLRITVLNFCSHLTFTYFWTNILPTERVNYRNTIASNGQLYIAVSQTFPTCHFYVHGLLFELLVYIYVGAQQGSGILEQTAQVQGNNTGPAPCYMTLLIISSS